MLIYNYFWQKTLLIHDSPSKTFDNQNDTNVRDKNKVTNYILLLWSLGYHNKSLLPNNCTCGLRLATKNPFHKYRMKKISTNKS